MDGSGTRGSCLAPPCPGLDTCPGSLVRSRIQLSHIVYQGADVTGAWEGGLEGSSPYRLP